MDLLNHIDFVQANYKLCKRTTFRGLPISVENCVGSVRKGVSDSGKPWRTVMKNDYGYIRKTRGVDGDHVDVFLGPNKNSDKVFVVHTMRPPDFKKFDEDKVMLGWDSADAARRAYLKHYDDPRFLGSVTEMSFAEFQKKVLATKNNPKKLAAATAVPAAVLDVMPTAHPPSLRNPSRVPQDVPGEEDDKYLDKTRRKSRSTTSRRMKKVKGHPTDMLVPPSVGEAHHTKFDVL